MVLGAWDYCTSFRIERWAWTREYWILNIWTLVDIIFFSFCTPNLDLTILFNHSINDSVGLESSIHLFVFFQEPGLISETSSSRKWQEWHCTHGGDLFGGVLLGLEGMQWGDWSIIFIRVTKKHRFVARGLRDTYGKHPNISLGRRWHLFQ